MKPGVAIFFTLGILLAVSACSRSERTTGPPPAKVKKLPKLADILERKIPVHYRRAHLGEVLYDLGSRVGLKSAYPKPIDGSFCFDLEEQQIAVGQVLEKLAAAGGLQLEWRNDTAVFWKPVEAARLKELEKLASAGSGRCAALAMLSQLGDPRIYPVLFEAMARGSEPMALLAARQLDELHTDTLRFAADHQPFADGLQRLLQVRPEQETQQLMNLAAASRSPLCGAMWIPLLDDEKRQAYAVNCIGETRDPRTVEPLLKLLRTAKPSDPNDDTGTPLASREQIIQVLGKIGSPQAIQALREMAQAEKTREAQLDLAAALFAAGDEQGLTILEQLLAESAAAKGQRPEPGEGAADPGGGAPGPPLAFRAYVVHALGQARDPRAVEPIIAVLADPRDEVRRAAIQQLGDLRDARAVLPLIDLLAKPVSQRETIEALQKIGDPRALDPVAKLVGEAGTAHARHAAAVYLFHAGDPRAADAMWATQKDLEPAYQYYAITTLAVAGRQQATDALVAQLQPDGTRRPRDAADALAVVRDIDTLPALAQALHIDNVDASFAAAAAISKMRHPKAIEQAITLLQHEEAKMRVWGGRILEWIGDPAATAALVAKLGDESPEVRLYASRALVSIGDAPSLAAALPMLKDPDRDVRRYTAQILHAKDPKAISALFTLLNDADSFVRGTAATALLASGDPAAIRRLAMQASSRSSDPPGHSAQRAFKPPGNFGWSHRADPCVLDELVLMMGDEDSATRAKAAGVLASMADPCAIPPLITALKDPATGVQNSARTALNSFPKDPRAKAALREN